MYVRTKHFLSGSGCWVKSSLHPHSLVCIINPSTRLRGGADQVRDTDKKDLEIWFNGHPCGLVSSFLPRDMNLECVPLLVCVRVCVFVYPTVKALAVGAGSSEVDVGVLADLVQGLGLAGHTLQIHHGNMTTLDQHLYNTHAHTQ